MKASPTWPVLHHMIQRRISRLSLSLITLALCVTALSAASQRFNTNIILRENIQGLNAKQIKRLHADMQRVIAILSSHRDVANPPSALCMHLSAYTPPFINASQQPTLDLQVPTDFHDGKCGEVMGYAITFRWNDPRLLLGDELTGPDGKPIIIQRSSVHVLPPVHSDKDGVQIFHRSILIQRKGVNLLEKVTREEYLNALIASWDRLLFEQSAAADLRSQRDAASHELDSLSATERKQPACLTDSLFSSAGDGDCDEGQFLYRVQPQYFSRMQSPSELRLLLIHYAQDKDESDIEDIQYLQKVFNSLNTKALSDVVNQP